jgi:uncharacterized protein
MSFAFLDIETSWERIITVIGIYRPGEGTTQLVAPAISVERLLEVMEGVTTVFTYNGGSFDLPVIAQALGVDLKTRHTHHDLLHSCRKHKLKGGLKAVERQLGIQRDTEGVDGLQAMHLWATHQRGHRAGGEAEEMIIRTSSESCCDALDVLLHYNREDCENLEILAQKLGIIPFEKASSGTLFQARVP